MTDKEKLLDNINKWTNIYLPGFSFRKYQLEYIFATLYSILYEDNHTNIIEAPTGSGKSIMIIIMAGVLHTFYHKTSYILCSDLYLWQQYSDAIEKYKLYFGKIKGNRGNYTCDETGVDFQMAPCRLSNISYANLFDPDWCIHNGWNCAAICEYIKERKKAVLSPVTVMTYQLYFPYMNDNDIKTPTGFKPRDIVFCDECHNIPNLCQQYGAIPLDKNKDIQKFRSLLEFCESDSKFKWLNLTEERIDEYIEKFNDIYNDIINTSYTKQVELRKLLNQYMDHLQILIECHKFIQAEYSNKTTKSIHKKLSKREYNAINTASWIDKLACSIKIYLRFSQGRDEYIVKTDNSVSTSEGIEWSDNPLVCFKFAKEDVWVYEFILKHQPHIVMLSATVGDQRSFDDNIGTHFTEQKKSVMYKMPSTFDYSKSPIYYIPGNKMSKDCIEQSFPINAKTINSILKSNKHINEKGIIHTGSYKNAYDLINLLDDDVKERVYIYNTSKEKQDVLLDYMMSKNGVLIGPTLTEGIDLPDDGCRFIIIMKIPYPYLGDNLVKAKSALFPRWYNAETSNNVIQGVGRGNRRVDDWSTTYILDGCFTALFQKTRHQYSDEFKNRIITLTNKP